MKRKRNNLDTLEANFIFSRVFLELNNYDKFGNIFITERNRIIDEICLAIISYVNHSNENIEVLKTELLSYKLSESEKKENYSAENYEDDLIKSENFESKLSKKYDKVIKDIVSKRIKEYL